MDCDLLTKLLQRVVPLDTLELSWGVLVHELVNGEETSADLDLDLATLDLNVHLTLAELIDALALTHEHDLQLLSVGVGVDVLGEGDIDRVRFERNVDDVEVDDVGSESHNLGFKLTDLLEEFEAGPIGTEALAFDILDVVTADLELLLEGLFVVHEAFVFSLQL